MPSESSGKKITRISISKKKATLYFKKEKVELSLDTFTNHYLYVDKELTKKEIDQLIKEDSNSLAYSYAKNLLYKGSYTEWVIREKLYKKEFEKNTIDEVIKKLKEDGLIDDKKYIKDYIELANSRLIGKNKIIQELSNYGVFFENFESLTFSRKIELQKANELLPKLERQYSSLSFPDKRKHIYDAYIRHGYDNDIALEMLSKIKTGSKKDEEEKLKRDFLKALRVNKTRYKTKQDLKDSIIRSLARKGYSIKQILILWEENEDEITC